MATLSEARHWTRDGFSPVKAIQAAADAIDDGSVPVLRDRIDVVHAFLVREFIPQRGSSEADGWDHLELTRLTEKLQALRERLVYADFGPRELRALRETLEDLHWIVAPRWPREPEDYAALPGSWIGG